MMLSVLIAMGRVTMSKETNKRIVFAMYGKSVKVDDYLGEPVMTQDDDELQQIAEHCMMGDFRISGYHIDEGE